MWEWKVIFKFKTKLVELLGNLLDWYPRLAFFPFFVPDPISLWNSSPQSKCPLPLSVPKHFPKLLGSEHSRFWNSLWIPSTSSWTGIWWMSTFVSGIVRTSSSKAFSESFRHLSKDFLKCFYYHIMFHTVLYSLLPCLFSLSDFDIAEGRRLCPLLEFAF